jgi:hypothetical protein
MTILMIIILMYLFYLMGRNIQVHEFRVSILDKISTSLTETINDKSLSHEEAIEAVDSMFNEFDRITYDKMLFSFKKLTIENFYGKDFTNIYE